MWIHQVGIMDKAKPALSMKVIDCVLMEKSPNHLNHGMITMIPPKIAVVVEKGQVKDLPANLGCSKHIYFAPNPKILYYDPSIVVFKAFHYMRKERREKKAAKLDQ